MSKKIDSLIIGNVTKDINIDFFGKKRFETGGAVYYSSMAAYNMGYNIMALTKAESKNDISDIKLPESRIIFKKDIETCTMENTYLSENNEKRIGKALKTGCSYNMNDIPTEVEPEIYYLAGLLYGDFPPEFIIELSKKSKIAIDEHAFVRIVDQKTREIQYQKYPYLKKVLPHIHFLKLVLYDSKTKKDIAKRMFDYGAKEIMTTDNAEAQVYNGKNFYTFPIKAKTNVGRTGRGDTCFSPYVCARITKNISDSLLEATAVLSQKLEYTGAFKGNKTDTEKYIKENYL